MLKSLSIVTLFLTLPPAFAVQICEPPARSDMIVGTGEAVSTADAKALAIADAVSIFGVKIEANSVVVDSNTSAFTQQSIQSETNAFVKGAEVLAECSTASTKKVTVGIKKSLLAGFVTERAEQRNSWLKTALDTITVTSTQRLRTEYRKILKEHEGNEKQDLDAWLILGRPKELFRSMDKDLLTKLRAELERKPTNTDIFIAASDPVAQKTLALLLQKLSQDGYKVTEAPANKADHTWSCFVTRGAPIGNAVRFTARCGLTGELGIEPVQVSSMAPVTSFDDVVILKVSNAISGS